MQSLELVFVCQFSADADWYFSQVNNKCFPECSDNRHELNLFVQRLISTNYSLRNIFFGTCCLVPKADNKFLKNREIINQTSFILFLMSKKSPENRVIRLSLFHRLKHNFTKMFSVFSSYFVIIVCRINLGTT